MQMKFSKSYKIQAVEKALRRTNGTTVKAVASTLGVGYSTLQKWIRQSGNQVFESVSTPEHRSTTQVTKEKRPASGTFLRPHRRCTWPPSPGIRVQIDLAQTAVAVYYSVSERSPSLVPSAFFRAYLARR